MTNVCSIRISYATATYVNKLAATSKKPSLYKSGKWGDLMSTIYCFLYISEMAMGYAELSLFAFCKHNFGGLMRRAMVGRMGVWGEEYAVVVCI